MIADHLTEYAASAWNELTGERLQPESLEILTESRNTLTLRLSTSKGSVVAKRCSAATASLEREIQQSFLNRLGKSVLRFYGVSKDRDPGYAWVFVEDARGVRYDPRNEEHRAAAARWLAELHSTIREQPAGISLPAKDAKYYRRLLENVIDMLGEQRGDLRFRNADHRRVLEAVAEHCREVSEVWHEIERAFPHGLESLVHGDIVTHNARIRDQSNGSSFVLFDWEKAGWGTPAEDLSDIDLLVYGRAADELGIGIERGELERLAGAGKIFRCLVFLEWLGRGITGQDVDAEEQALLCLSWLDQLMDDTPWAE